ncbi:MAG: protein phosphatase 2C domain-containing protein [Aureliella sp.]
MKQWKAEAMREAKNTQRALVRIGFDGKVHKLFRGPRAEERFENEVRVLRFLEKRKCPFVPRLLESDEASLTIVTSNCGAIVESISEDKAQEVFEELEQYGVRHEDPFPRNITYRASDGRFCAIDFEFATILDDEDTTDELQADDSQGIAKIIWSGSTDCGKFRPNNEDAYLLLRLDGTGIQYLGKTGEAPVDDTDYIFAVSDGMGGQDSGEFASRIALEKITTRLPKEYLANESDGQGYTEEVLLSLIESIHDAMLAQGRYDPNCRNMGATLTLAWLHRGQVTFAHIGDSRLYLVDEKGGWRQCSEDHSYVGWLRKEGKLNEREARVHPRKNVLNQALGAGHQYLKPQIGTIRLGSGCRLLICSDGITEALWDERVIELLRLSAPELAAETLVQKAVGESGRDNATAVVVSFLGDSESESSECEGN